MRNRYMTKNEDGETEFHYIKALVGHCTFEVFQEAQVSKCYQKSRRSVKIDGKNNRVLLNDDGVCTVEQFGTRERAVEMYNQIAEWVRRV